MISDNRPVPLLEVIDLHTSFDTRRGVVKAVDGVSFTVGAGEIVALVGESGCGKSVAVRSILKLLPIDATRFGPGQVRWNGRNLLELGESELEKIRGKEIAMVFQDPMASLNPVLRIGEQIDEMLLTHLRMSRQEARRRTVELLDLVGIPAAKVRADSYPHEFSGGMRQRVMIAMALACNPKVLLADEITTALDVTIQAQILELLQSLTARLGTAVLMITHDLGIVAGVAKRVYVMYAGTVVETASTEDLFGRPMMPYTWGLLRSAPRLNQSLSTPLTPIEGMPPDLASLPKGCRFQPRCAYRRPICAEREPDLVRSPGAAHGHRSRCWGTQDTSEGGWLRAIDWRTELGDPQTHAEIQCAWTMTDEVAAPGRENA